MSVRIVDTIDFKVAESGFLHEDSMDAFLGGSGKDVSPQVVTGNVDLPDFEGRILGARVGFDIAAGSEIQGPGVVGTILNRLVDVLLFGAGSGWVVFSMISCLFGRSCLDAQAASGRGDVNVLAVGGSRSLLGIGTLSVILPPILPFDLEHVVVGFVRSVPCGALFTVGNQLLGLLPDDSPLVNCVAES